MAMNCVEEIGVIEVVFGHGIVREGVVFANCGVSMLSVSFILLLATCIGSDAFSISPEQTDVCGKADFIIFNALIFAVVVGISLL